MFSSEYFINVVALVSPPASESVLNLLSHFRTLLVSLHINYTVTCCLYKLLLHSLYIPYFIKVSCFHCRWIFNVRGIAERDTSNRVGSATLPQLTVQ